MKLSATTRVSITCSLFATLLAAVPASAQTVFPAPNWQVAKPETQAMSSEGVEKVGQWLKDSGAKAGLVVRHGVIVGEWYFEDAKPETKHLVYSTSKSFSSVAAGLAIGDGKLKLDSTVGEFFPDANPAEKRKITIKQLLSMTSGARTTIPFCDAKTCSSTCSTNFPWSPSRVRSGTTTTPACRC